MMTLKFADTHNMVAFLSKPTKSDGFEQIVDFLNAHPIRYALTINPTIYISCIEQFWSTVKVKTINGEAQLHALVDGKKIIITESSVRRDLQLADEEGVDCLPNSTIFEQLTLCLSPKTTAWNEFKTVNEEVQLQALVDGKKIIITESTVKRDLQLEDAEGVDCLPNATVFEQLTLMGYEKISQKLTFYKAFFSPQWKFLIHSILQSLSSKTIAWNEFSSTMASAITCLAINQKFNFSKYIFESMVKNLDNMGKFLMYPRFEQVFLDKQLEGMATHDKDQAEMGEGSTNPTDPYHTPTIIQPSPQPQKKQKPRKPKRKDTQIPQSSGPTEHVVHEVVYKEVGMMCGPRRQETMGDIIAQTRFENVSKHSNDPLLTRGNTLQSGEDSLKLNELMTLCTNLQQRVLDLETTKTTQANEIASLKRRVKRLEKKRLRTHGLKRINRVGSSRRVESFEDEGLGEEEASKQGRIADIDANNDIYLVNVYTDEDMFGVNDLDGDEVIVNNVDVFKTVEETRSVVEEVIAIIEKAKLVSAAKETVNAAATIVSTTSTIPFSAATTSALQREGPVMFRHVADQIYTT
ncbi:hypothetical protein Tco_0775717 [Tanacetum coccineum]